MSDSEILDVMITDHEQVLELLNKVKQTGVNKMVDRFDALEWYLKKHMFVEEKAVFESFNMVVTDGYEVVPRLVDEHNRLLNMLRDIRRKIIDGKKIDFGGFETLMFSHKDFEEISVYPRLDQELSAEDKEKLLIRIRDII
jgi:hemerythrin-like domain-containing protein